jgi:hypothetical protein
VRPIAERLVPSVPVLCSKRSHDVSARTLHRGRERVNAAISSGPEGDVSFSRGGNCVRPCPFYVGGQDVGFQALPVHSFSICGSEAAQLPRSEVLRGVVDVSVFGFDLPHAHDRVSGLAARQFRSLRGGGVAVPRSCDCTKRMMSSTMRASHRSLWPAS